MVCLGLTITIFAEWCIVCKLANFLTSRGLKINAWARARIIRARERTSKQGRRAREKTKREGRTATSFVTVEFKCSTHQTCESVKYTLILSTYTLLLFLSSPRAFASLDCTLLARHACDNPERLLSV